MTPYATGCTQVCNQGRDCTCAPQPCGTVPSMRISKKAAAAAVVDTDRERDAQDAWLALVRRSGASAGVHTGDAGGPAPLPTDWGVVTIIALAVLAFVGSMVMLYMGLPVVVAALPVVQAMVLELIREVIA